MSIASKVREQATGHPFLAFVTTGIATLGTVLGFGAVTGGAELARRNNKWELVAAVLVLLLGMLLSLAAIGWARDGLLAVGLLVMFAGLAVATFAVFDREVGRPAISVNLSEGSKRLVATVDAGGLPADEEVQILITAEPAGEPLYRSSFGPDPSGDVKRTVEFPLQAARDYDRVLIRAWLTGADPAECQVLDDFGSKTTTGCAALALPSANLRPRLSATWEDGSLVVTVGATGVGNGSAVGLRVTAQSPFRSRQLYGGNLGPQDGTVAETIKLSVPPGSRRVCVEAMIVPRDDAAFTERLGRGSCPRRPSGALAWARLFVPR